MPVEQYDGGNHGRFMGSNGYVEMCSECECIVIFVVGPSGSGKSTLLNTLACRLDVNTIVEGEMRLNGAPYNNAELKRIAGYVMQSDLLNGYLTVRETLMYTAKLRLPRSFTDAERHERVEEVMADLGLSHVHDVIVGTPLKKGISGGERKRLCVGMQMLNRPQLLFLDEPTSGLDSVMALDLVRTLHMLAHGRAHSKAVTIVCAIHQPQAKIFNLFDSLILLKGGNIIFQGPRRQAMVRIDHSQSIC
jgi:ATP-binding cassette, subfamily G (WHITE), member 2